MTPDDLMAMHRVTVAIIEQTRALSADWDGRPFNVISDQEVVDAVRTLNSAVDHLAVVQRDLLKAMLGG